MYTHNIIRDDAYIIVWLLLILPVSTLNVITLFSHSSYIAKLIMLQEQQAMYSTSYKGYDSCVSGPT